MIAVKFIALGLAAGLSLGGCKIVMDVPEDEQAIAADASGDDARIEIRLDDTFDTELLPLVRENALPIGSFRTDLAKGVDLLGAEHGNRGAGAGAAWNFPVSGEGTVVEARLDTRARWVGLDTTGDGETDTTLQLGPVIKGTAMRDVAPFFRFDDFRDQIEFAKLGRAINDRLSASIAVPEGDLVGQKIRFTGVVPLRSAEEDLVVTPTDVEVSQ